MSQIKCLCILNMNRELWIEEVSWVPYFHSFSSMTEIQEKDACRTKIFPSLSYLHHQQKFKHNIAASVCIWHHHRVIKKRHNRIKKKKNHNTYVPIPHPLHGLRVVHHAWSLSSSLNPHTHISSTCHLPPLTPTLDDGHVAWCNY